MLFFKFFLNLLMKCIISILYTPVSNADVQNIVFSDINLQVRSLWLILISFSNCPWSQTSCYNHLLLDDPFKIKGIQMPKWKSDHLFIFEVHISF